MAYSRYYPVIFLEVLRKTTKGLTKDSRCPGQDSIQAPPVERYRYTTVLGGDGDSDNNIYDDKNNENDFEDNNYDDNNDNKKFWEELIAYFPLLRRGPHRKRRVQQFFYCCLCIRCRGNFFTEPLSSNDRGIHIQTQRLMGFFLNTSLRWAQVLLYTYQVP
jgi:hypothetical protein